MRYQSELDRIIKSNERTEKEIVNEYLKKLKIELTMPDEGA